PNVQPALWRERRTTPFLPEWHLRECAYGRAVWKLLESGGVRTVNYVGNEPAPAGMVLVGDSNPVGMIAWVHQPPDASWLILNGAAYAKASYPDLWAFASSGGLLTADQVANPGLYKDAGGGNFNVPNLAGLFIRAQGGNSAALGVKQADDNKPHVHTTTL